MALKIPLDLHRKAIPRFVLTSNCRLSAADSNRIFTSHDILGSESYSEKWDNGFWHAEDIPREQGHSLPDLVKWKILLYQDHRDDRRDLGLQGDFEVNLEARNFEVNTDIIINWFRNTPISRRALWSRKSLIQEGLAKF